MRKTIFAVSLAIAALTPSIASASCQDRIGKTGGTLIGAGAGAVLGSAIAGRNDRGLGAVLGGIGGAIAGNTIAKSKGDCARAYGYYDTNGVWHVNSTDRTTATGYYDRSGQWVDGQPNGYYDTSGRWVATSSGQSSGYYDVHNHWVPASSSGYYENDDRLVNGSASGHYDRRGHWVPGATMGYYNTSGPLCPWFDGRSARLLRQQWSLAPR
jgi:hypothetical protein